MDKLTGTRFGLPMHNTCAHYEALISYTEFLDNNSIFQFCLLVYKMLQVAKHQQFT